MFAFQVEPFPIPRRRNIYAVYTRDVGEFVRRDGAGWRCTGIVTACLDGACGHVRAVEKFERARGASGESPVLESSYPGCKSITRALRPAPLDHSVREAA